jgi:hypothetical protein
MQAIARGDTAMVGLLRRTPDLAVATLSVGAARASAAAFYLGENSGSSASTARSRNGRAALRGRGVAVEMERVEQKDRKIGKEV